MTSALQENNDIGVFKLDRLQVSAWLSKNSSPPDIPGYRVVRDSFVRSQTTTRTFLRNRELINAITRTRIFIQYQAQLPGLPPFKVTLVPDDSSVLSRQDILKVIKHFSRYRLLLVELALDLHPESGFDLGFVRRYGLFGKSRPGKSRLFFRTALYGARHSDKLVRCYRKENLNVFRVELELHSRLLRRYGIAQVRDLIKLPAALYPRHIRFARLKWEALGNRRLLSDFKKKRVFRRLRKEAASIHSALDFLRSNVGVRNTHRFLRAIAPSAAVHDLLETWAQEF